MEKHRVFKKGYLNLADFRHRVVAFLSRISRKFKLVKPEQECIEKDLSLLSTDQTSYTDSLKTIRKFYEQNKGHKVIFFQLLDAMLPARIDLILNQIYAAMDTPEWLITLREDLMSLEKKEKMPPMENLRCVFKEYFSKIFNFQYLNTKDCNSQNTSVKLLKYIAEKEGVHPSECWWSFEDRLNRPDRVILSLEHFKMPSIPLVYVEIAFSRGLIRNIAEIIGPECKSVDVCRANTAVFYSLNTTFDGLRGIGLGRKMIIRAGKFLKANYPHISCFVTLSPVLGFRNYLEIVLKTKDHGFTLTKEEINKNYRHQFLTKDETKKIRQELLKDTSQAKGYSISEILRTVLKKEEWFTKPVFYETMGHPLKSLVLYYLKWEKRVNSKTGKTGKESYDPVENFHLANGAYIGGINYCSDTSAYGLEKSFGMMVSYIYNERIMDINKSRYSEGNVVVKI